MIKITEISADPPAGFEKKPTEKLTADFAGRIADLNEILRAQQKHALLVILQGMDGSGKDGAVKKVFKDCTPFNLSVTSFKKPTPIEFSHDFLWRVHQNVPAKGEIKIFNRSHYEDILVQRVHGWIDEKRVKQRMDAINAFEEMLTFDNQTIILKFYMHISPEQQEIELQQRLDDPKKYWKHNDGDWEERKHWGEYMKCYDYVFHQSTIPWTIVPVDSRWYRDYVIAKTVCEAMEKMDLAYPEKK